MHSKTIWIPGQCWEGSVRPRFPTTSLAWFSDSWALSASQFLLDGFAATICFSLSKDYTAKAALNLSYPSCYILSLFLKSPGKKKRNSSGVLSHAQGTIIHHSCYQAPFSGLDKDYTSFKKVFASIFVSESLASWILEQPTPHPGAAAGGGELYKAPSPKGDAKRPGSSL